MLILSWNVHFQSLPGQLHNIVEAIRSVMPDIVTLQEVKTSLADDMKRRLADIGLVHAFWSGKDAPPRLLRATALPQVEAETYQCLIASRWPVTAGGDRWRRRSPYPELIARATVSVPDEEDIDVFTAHIPNGSNHGWRKIDAFNVLSAELRRGIDSPAS